MCLRCKVIYELELLHCYHLNIISLLLITLTYIYKPLQMPSDSALLKERAVAEILEETKRAAIRAEVRSFLRHVYLIIVKLRQGSGKDRQKMALKAKGLKA